MPDMTEITVTTGDRYRVVGSPSDIEQLILDAARGSIMQLAWMVEAATGERLGFNPDCVVSLRATSSLASEAREVPS